MRKLNPKEKKAMPPKRKGFGGAQPNSGRKLGSKNKKTLEWEAFGKKFVEENLSGILEEMETLKESDPEKYLDVFFKGLEYFKPKLNRTEMTGKDGEKLLGPMIYYPKTNERTTDLETE